MTQLVSVIIRHKSKFVDKEFTYLANENLQIGSQVLVPFGMGNKPYEGIVSGIVEQETQESFKPIIRMLADYVIPSKKIELARWIRQEYMCSLSEAVGLFVPKEQEMTEIYEYILTPTVAHEELFAAAEKERRTAKNRIMLLQLLQEGEVNISHLQRELNKSLLEAAKAIEQKELAVVEKRRINRIPQNEYRIEKKNVILGTEQQEVLASIQKNVKNKVPTLLYGITGSGKTEVYIELIKKCVEQGKQAMLLVPEISLTPQTIARFKNVFGNRIAVFHSKISQGERKDQIDLILKGEMDIVIGARSALFSPLEHLGLIIIDECHDDAYKSEQSPRYDSIEVAEKLCEIYGAGLVLGSATPTVEQYYHSVYGKFDLQMLRRRQKGSLPTIQLIDTYQEFKSGNTDLISKEIIHAIQEEIRSGKQVIVFLNQRGYAQTLSCNLCNHTVMCPSCDISLTYHKEGQKLLCHYCGHSEPYQKKCKSCEQGEYRDVGYGTQRIEMEIQSAISEAVAIRLDKDTTQLKGGHEKLLNAFKEKKANVLIGTQMITKGLDFESVSLVVILNADRGLRFPDYRSREKTLSTILQVSGRAGRGEHEGRVIIQTNDSQNKIFEFALNQDYQSFFWEEIKERKAFLYPPFSSLIKIQSSAVSEVDCAETAERIKDAVDFYLRKREREVITLGPVPNLIRRIENKFRWQLFYKIVDKSDLALMKSIIRFILSEKRSIIVKKGVAVSVEINPKNLI